MNRIKASFPKTLFILYDRKWKILVSCDITLIWYYLKLYRPNDDNTRLFEPLFKISFFVLPIQHVSKLYQFHVFGWF